MPSGYFLLWKMAKTPNVRRLMDGNGTFYTSWNCNIIFFFLFFNVLVIFGQKFFLVIFTSMRFAAGRLPPLLIFLLQYSAWIISFMTGAYTIASFWIEIKAKIFRFDSHAIPCKHRRKLIMRKSRHVKIKYVDVKVLNFLLIAVDTIETKLMYKMLHSVNASHWNQTTFFTNTFIAIIFTYAGACVLSPQKQFKTFFFLLRFVLRKFWQSSGIVQNSVCMRNVRTASIAGICIYSFP